MSSWKPFTVEELENFCGRVISVSGPVVTANNMHDSILYELVKVGYLEMIGEIIYLDGDVATIQIYDEEYCNATVGDYVLKTRQLLSIELGPGIMGNIFDGVLRPLSDIKGDSEGIYLSALDHHVNWDYNCLSSIKIGSHIRGGDIFGVVLENSLFEHKIMLPPTSKGTVVFKANPGNYYIDDILLETEYCGNKSSFTMSQVWPIRTPRPVTKKLPFDCPLFTGKRICDTLLPCAQGGSTVISEPLGSRKAVLSQALGLHSNSDIIIHIGGKEREKTFAEILEDLSKLPIKVNGVSSYLMNRTALVVNSSNVPITIHEASIHTGATLSEYFRDMGFNVCMLADSTSRWANALNTITEKSGCPSIMNTRLTSFYERAGRVKCLGGNPEREGSVSIIGALNSHDCDFPDQVTRVSLDLVKVLWGLDKKSPQLELSPPIDWNSSYSLYTNMLDGFYYQNYPDFVTLRNKMEKILQEEKEIQEIKTLVGIESLAELDKITLNIAKILRKEFLQQDSNECCPFYKTIGILRNIMTIYDLSWHAIESDTLQNQITWSTIKKKLKKILPWLFSMRFKEPIEHKICTELDKIYEEIMTIFTDEILI